MFLGIDLGTSGVKSLITDEQGAIVSAHSAALDVQRPAPLWSEQHPQDWWQALEHTLAALREEGLLAGVSAIGLTGQMHGAVCLDAKDRVIRPAILWNDGRSEAKCKTLESQVANCRSISGNIMMPGFTAPKIAWMREHEPAFYSRIAKVLLPKDYLRLRLTGDYASDMSDAAGTLWMDTGARDWHDGLLNACGLDRSHMPELFEGNQITGTLTAELAEKWGMSRVPVVAGGGDNAAGAIGAGIVYPGQAMLSLGTSGVTFVVSDGFNQNTDSAVHSFCHALPDTWHLMSVHLSAASCLQWLSDKVLSMPVADAVGALNHADIDREGAAIFLPYLSGERTPHNSPHARGVMFGLTHESDPLSLTHSVLEGVCLAFADGLAALRAANTKVDEVSLIGGGARSPYWRQLLADVLGCTVSFREGGDVGPAYGAAKLAQLAITPGAEIKDICKTPEILAQHKPDQCSHEFYTQRYATFKQLYQSVKPLFA